MSLYTDNLTLTDEERQEVYRNNCRNDARIKRDILRTLKDNLKANIVSDVRINANKYLKDIGQLYTTLANAGFNVELDGQTVWLRDMSCGYISQDHDRNKVYFRFWC